MQTSTRRCVAPKCRSAPRLLASGASDECAAGGCRASRTALLPQVRLERAMGDLSGSDIERDSRPQRGWPAGLCPVDAYNLVNLYVGYQPTPDILANFGIDSVFNK